MNVVNPWPTPILIDEWQVPHHTDILADLVQYPTRLEDVAADQVYPSDLFSKAREHKLQNVCDFCTYVVEPFFRRAALEIFKEQLDSYDFHVVGWTVGSLGPAEHLPRQLHSHPEAILSAVFYIYIPKHDMEGGKLTLYDPRWNADRGYPQKMRHLFAPLDVMPEAGKMVAFPSFIHHAIEPHRGPRLAIAADLIIVPEYKQTLDNFNDKKCPECGGWGDVAGGRRWCSECNGTGIQK